MKNRWYGVGLVLVALASCNELVERGYFGEWLPDYCRGDKLDSQYNDVVVVRSSLRDSYPLLLDSLRVLGQCVLCNQPDRRSMFIVIEERLDHRQTRGAIRHEKCHIETYMRTGSPVFHD